MEAKFSLAELGRMKHFPGNLDLYVRKFQEKALDCCDGVDEEVLVNVFLHGMTLWS